MFKFDFSDLELEGEEESLPSPSPVAQKVDHTVTSNANKILEHFRVLSVDELVCIVLNILHAQRCP